MDNTLAAPAPPSSRSSDQDPPSAPVAPDPPALFTKEKAGRKPAGAKTVRGGRGRGGKNTVKKKEAKKTAPKPKEPKKPIESDEENEDDGLESEEEAASINSSEKKHGNRGKVSSGTDRKESSKRTNTRHESDCNISESLTAQLISAIGALNADIISLRGEVTASKQEVAELTKERRTLKSRDVRESEHDGSPARPSKRNGKSNLSAADGDSRQDNTAQMLADIINCNGQARPQHRSDHDSNANRKFLLALALGAMGSM